MTAKKPPRGRPRSEEADERILEATRRLLAEQGYSRMSMDAVAQASGVSRPTIYLRWPSKEELVIAAVEDLEQPDRTVPTDDTYGDLQRILRDVKTSFVDHGNAMLMGPIQTERHHSPRLYEAFRDRLLRPRRGSVRRILEHGIDRGTIRADLDVDATTNALVGSLYAKLMTGDEITDDFTDRVVETIWAGIAADASRRRAPLASDIS